MDHADQHVDALLAAQPVGFVGDTGHRVHPRDPDGDVSRAELCGRGAEPFHEPALLEVALAPAGDHQRPPATHAGPNGERDLGDIDRRGFGCAGRRDPPQHRVRADRHTQPGDDRGGDRGQQPDPSGAAGERGPPISGRMSPHCG
ncbi:hypothetical protein [Nocardia wallacei]|uniref:hypothetical protein n=1 Tax=Nocardia wallacei TaxID=480035 RepID=UPI00245863B9|nr:hypothetical protein [Nocardia wallacei]